MKNKVLVAMGIGIFAALTFNAASVTTLAEGTDPVQPDEKKSFDDELQEAKEARIEAEGSVDTALQTITGDQSNNEENNEENKEIGINGAEANLEQAAEAVYGALDDEEELPFNEKKITEETKPDSQNINTELTDGNWVNDYDAKDGKNPTNEADLPSHVTGGTDVKEALNDVNGKLDELNSMEKNDIVGGINEEDGYSTGAIGELYRAAAKGEETVKAAEGLAQKANILTGVEPDPEDPDKPTILDTIKAANDEVDKASDIIANAGSEEEAKTALGVAQKAVNDADQKVKDLTAEIEKIEKQLADLEEQDGKNREELENKKTQLKNARDAFYAKKQEALADVAAAHAELSRLIGEPDGDVVLGEDSIGVDKLLQDAETAFKEYDETIIEEYKGTVYIKALGEEYTYEHREDGYKIIKALEDKLSDPTTTKNLSDYRTLVWAIMKYYYIPEVEGGVMTDTCEAFIEDNNFKNDKSKWQAESGQYAYIDAEGEYHQSTEGDVLRYGTVHYNLNGKDCEMKVNYKTVDENNLGAKKFPGLVIFKKTEHQMIRVDNGSSIPTEMEITPAFESALDQAIAEEGYYEKDGNIFARDENGKIVRYSAGTPTLSSNIPAGDIDSADNLVLGLNDSKQLVSLGDEDKISYELVDGVLTKIVKKDVTVTTYTGSLGEPVENEKTIDGHSANLVSSEVSKNTFVGAVQDMIDALEDGQFIKIGSGDDAVVYTKDSIADETGYKEISSGVSGSYTIEYKKDKFEDKYISQSGYKNKPTAITEGENALELGTDEALNAKIANLKSLYNKVETKVESYKFSNDNNSQNNKHGYQIIITAYNVASKDYVAKDSKEAIKAAKKDGIKENSIISTQNTVNYGYEALNYILSTPTVKIENSSETTTMIYSTAVCNVASTEKTRFRNDNWYTGNLILLENDNNLVSDENGKPISISYLTDGSTVERNVPSEVTLDASQNDDFRNKIDGIGKVPTAYANLIEKAKASKAALKKADALVKQLEQEIMDLECSNATASIRDFNANLDKAKANLKKAQDDRDNLIKKLDDLEKQYDDKINELNTPEPTVMIVGTADVVVDAPLIVDAPADDVPAVAAPAGAVLGANRPLETLGSVRSGSVLGERRGPQGAVLGKRRSPKTADGAMGGMVAGMMLSMMSAFGGAKVLKKKDEE